MLLKILFLEKCIENAKGMRISDVDSVVEMDETFIAESCKGNHKKSGIDRNCNVILEPICKGKKATFT